MNVLLAAVKKDKLTEYTSLVIEAGLRPAIVDIDSFALENMYGVNYEIKEGETVALINIGASLTNINILKGEMFAFTRDVSIGGNRYTESIQKELGISYDDAERAKRESVEGLILQPWILLSKISLPRWRARLRGPLVTLRLHLAMSV